MFSYNLPTWVRDWLFGASLLGSMVGFGLAFDAIADTVDVVVVASLTPPMQTPPSRGGVPR